MLDVHTIVGICISFLVLAFAGIETNVYWRYDSLKVGIFNHKTTVRKENEWLQYISCLPDDGI
jgi:hypothetical protein